MFDGNIPVTGLFTLKMFGSLLTGWGTYTTNIMGWEAEMDQGRTDARS